MSVNIISEVFTLMNRIEKTEHIYQTTRELEKPSYEVGTKHFANSAFSELKKKIDSLVAPTPELLIDLGLAAMDEVSWEEDYLNPYLTKLEKHDVFFPVGSSSPQSDIHIGFSVFFHNKLQINILHCDKHLLGNHKNREIKGSIPFSGNVEYLKILRLKKGKIVMSRWELPSVDFDSLSGDISCIKKGQIVLEEGDAALMDYRKESYLTDYIDSSFVALQLVVETNFPVAMEFDHDAMKLISLASNKEYTSRLQMMATILRVLDVQEGIPLLREFLHHDDYHVRWNVMRELLALNAQSVLSDLQLMAKNDPSASLRKNAHVMLEKLGC